MNKEEKLKEATRLIQRLVPSLLRRTPHCEFGKEVEWIEGYATIHLEDVMDTLGFEGEYIINSDSNIFLRESNGCLIHKSEYIFGKPFTNQSEEFYNFLIKTLRSND